jgi:hypothetical protein
MAEGQIDIDGGLLVERTPPCDPKLCALAGHPHAHCTCGLPMAPAAEGCQLCRRERLDPVGLRRRRRTGDSEAWDGLSFPSRRRCRIGSGDRERYRHLIAAVLRPEEPDSLRVQPAGGEADDA